VRSVSFSPDGRCLALITSRQRVSDSAVEVRDRETGQRLFPPRSFHECKLASVAYTPDSQELLVLADDGKVRVLRADTADELRTYDVPFRQIWPREKYARLQPLPPLPERLALISPDGKQVVLLPDLHSLDPPAEFRVQEETTFLALAYEQHNKRLAAAGLDGTIRLWDVQAPHQPATVLRGHKGAVTGVTYSSDGRRLASCGQDGTVRIWDPGQKLELLILKGYSGASSVLFRQVQADSARVDSKGSERLAIAHGNTVTVLLPGK
jgi:WD40 repeat protein